MSAQSAENAQDVLAVPNTPPHLPGGVNAAEYLPTGYQGGQAASTPSEPSSASAVPPTLAPQLDDLNAFGTPLGSAKQECNNRVQVLCRFRRPLDTDKQYARSSNKGYPEDLWDGGWLHFEDLWEEEAGGSVGGATTPLETVCVRVGYDWNRRAFDRVFKPEVGQPEVGEIAG